MEELHSLADEILAAFQRAWREGDMEVADHLLKALEVLASREEAREVACSRCCCQGPH